MLYIHPLMQTAASLAALYVLYLGIRRFCSLHLGRKVRFPRKRHVLLGKLVLAAWLLGAAAAAVLVRYYWHKWFITGGHAAMGLSMLPMMGLSLASGLILGKRPQARKALPLIHGLAGLALIIMACIQFFGGLEVIRDFVQGV